MLQFLVCLIVCCGELPEWHCIACVRRVVARAGFVIENPTHPQIPVFYQRTIARDASSQWDFRRDIPQVPRRLCINCGSIYYLAGYTLSVQGRKCGPKAWNISLHCVGTSACRRNTCHIRARSHWSCIEVDCGLRLQVVIIEGGKAISPPHTYAIDCS